MMTLPNCLILTISVPNSFQTLLVLIQPTNSPETELPSSASSLPSFIKEIVTVFCDIDVTRLLDCDNNTKTLDSVLQFLTGESTAM